MGTRPVRRAWASQQTAREAAVRILGEAIFDYLEAPFILYRRASREAGLVVSPYTDLRRKDRLRRAVLSGALDSALDHHMPGSRLGEQFNPAGLTYFGIAVGLDPVPRDAINKSEVRSAALVFKQDRKNLWRQTLHEELKRRQNVRLRTVRLRKPRRAGPSQRPK